MRSRAPRPRSRAQELLPNDVREVPMTDDAKGWIEDELAGCRFVDRRLERRLHALLGRMADAMGQSLPLACGDWASTKAAYRFFANDRVGEGDILWATSRRPAGASPPPAAPSSSSRTPPSSPTSAQTPTGSARPAGSTAAGTRRGASGCTQSADC